MKSALLFAAATAVGLVNSMAINSKHELSSAGASNTTSSPTLQFGHNATNAEFEADISNKTSNSTSPVMAFKVGEEKRKDGINCHGSSECIFSSKHDGPSRENLMGDMWWWMKEGDPDATYEAGEHIVCDNEKFCLFPQKNSRPLGALEIANLTLMMWQHKCAGCGSIPIGYLDGDNDPDSHGILTVNYVMKHVCNGACRPSPVGKQWPEDLETGPWPAKPVEAN